MKYRLSSTLLFAAMAAALAPVAAATTWYVNGVTGSNSYNCLSATTACNTIGRAIFLAASGDSILVAPTTYPENLIIGKSLHIIGSGASTTIVDGQRVGSVVAIVNGGIYVTLSNLTVQNGLAVNGGGIANGGPSSLTITNCVISGNTASGTKGGSALGGGIYNGGPLIISNSTLSGNSAYPFQAIPGGYGGAIWNSGTATVAYSTLTGNAAFGFGYGGAVYNRGTLMVSHSTLSGDGATFGIINNGNGGMLRVDDSTVSNNRVTTVLGAGISNGGGTLTISNVTVTGNGVGIRNASGTTTLQNSIVANNSSGNCSGSMTSSGYNLSSDGSCPFTRTGDLNNTNPLLGPLQNNGGPTQTQALLSGSPAIDSGNPGGCTDGQGHLLTTDQRGAPRPDKEDTAGCDRGAFERQTD